MSSNAGGVSFILVLKLIHNSIIKTIPAVVPDIAGRVERLVVVDVMGAPLCKKVVPRVRSPFGDHLGDQSEPDFHGNLDVAG